MKEKLVWIASLVWSVLVVFYWSLAHYSKSDVHWYNIFLPLILFSTITFGSFLYFAARSKSLRFTLPLHPVLVILSVFLTLGIFLTTVSFIAVDSKIHYPLMSFAFWLPSMKAFSIFFLQAILGLITITLITWCAGSSIKKYFPLPTTTPTALHVFLTFIFGICLLIVLSLGLSLFGTLTPSVSLCVSLFFILTQISSVKKIFLWVLQKRSLTFSLQQANFWLGFITFLFVCLAFFDIMKPGPTGFDDMTHYLNRVHALAISDTLPFGGLPMMFELFVGFFQALSFLPDNTLFPALLTSFFLFLLTGSSLYYFVLWYTKNHTASLIALSLWTSLSMTQSLLTREAKPDILLFFVGILLLWSFFLWIRERDILFVPLMAFLFGLALSIKLTAFFFAPGFLLVLWWLWAQHSLPPISVRIILLSILVAATPLLLWVSVAFYSYTLLPENTARYTETYGLNIFSTVSSYQFSNFNKNSVPYSCPIPLNADFNQYNHQKGSIFWRALVLPWNITMNNQVGFFVTEIGFLFLILLPVIFLLHLVLTKSTSSESVILFMLTAAYWLSWGLLGNNIPWYAFPGFIFFFLLIAGAATMLSSGWRRFFFILIFLHLLTQFSVRLQYFAPPAVIGYIGGHLTADQFYPALYPDIAGVAKQINQSPEKNFITTASKIFYLIDNNYRRGFIDQRLDLVTCLITHASPEESLAILRSHNIGFIYVTPALKTENQRLGGDESQRMQAFQDFADSFLISYPALPGLYQIP